MGIMIRKCDIDVLIQVFTASTLLSQSSYTASEAMLIGVYVSYLAVLQTRR